MWDVKLSGMMGMFTGMIKKHIKSGTEQALQAIKKEVEGLMVDIIIDVFNFIFTVILVGVFFDMAFIDMHSMYQSFTKTPFLDIFDNKSTSTPKVSVILPARNEEEFISKCLETLSSQDYNNFEIIAIR